MCAGTCTGGGCGCEPTSLRAAGCRRPHAETGANSCPRTPVSAGDTILSLRAQNHESRFLATFGPGNTGTLCGCGKAQKSRISASRCAAVQERDHGQSAVYTCTRKCTRAFCIALHRGAGIRCRPFWLWRPPQGAACRCMQVHAGACRCMQLGCGCEIWLARRRLQRAPPRATGPN